MLVLLCSIFLAIALIGLTLFLIGNIGTNRFARWIDYNSEISFGFTLVGSILFIALLTITLFVGVDYSEIKIIDEKIELYQQENTEIEEEISIIVKDYMDYESSTFSDLKNVDPAVVLSLYPELKANELVTKQVDLYVGNNNTIKSLECKRLDLEVAGWWLFFK